MQSVKLLCDNFSPVTSVIAVIFSLHIVLNFKIFRKLVVKLPFLVAPVREIPWVYLFVVTGSGIN